MDYEKLYMAILALVIIIATFYLGDRLLTSTIPLENRDILNVALGMILGLSGTVVGYYFGSSKSSSDKQKIIKYKEEIKKPKKMEKTDASET
jgi:hypothetical protein